MNHFRLPSLCDPTGNLAEFNDLSGICISQTCDAGDHDFAGVALISRSDFQKVRGILPEAYFQRLSSQFLLFSRSSQICEQYIGGHQIMHHDGTAIDDDFRRLFFQDIEEIFDGLPCGYVNAAQYPVCPECAFFSAEIAVSGDVDHKFRPFFILYGRAFSGLDVARSSLSCFVFVVDFQGAWLSDEDVPRRFVREDPVCAEAAGISSQISGVKEQFWSEGGAQFCWPLCFFVADYRSAGGFGFLRFFVPSCCNQYGNYAADNQRSDQWICNQYTDHKYDHRKRDDHSQASHHYLQFPSSGQYRYDMMKESCRCSNAPAASSCRENVA